MTHVIWYLSNWNVSSVQKSSLGSALHAFGRNLHVWLRTLETLPSYNFGIADSNVVCPPIVKKLFKISVQEVILKRNTRSLSRVRDVVNVLVAVLQTTRTCHRSVTSTQARCLYRRHSASAVAVVGFAENRFSRGSSSARLSDSDTLAIGRSTADHGHRERQDRACIGQRDDMAALPVLRLWLVLDN